MLKVKISNFIKNNKDKIIDLGIKLIIVAIIVFIATIILSQIKKNENDKSEALDKKSVYNPKYTIIKGTDISDKQYNSDSNVVENFLSFCNEGKTENAYELLSNECKEELYPTIEDFKNNYYNVIFNEKKEYNLQSWISTTKYTVYKIRYTNEMMTTGKYDENNVYQDYITMYKTKNNNVIFIGNLISSDTCNIVTNAKEIQATVIKKNIYISDEEYQIKFKNNSNKIILIDDLESNNTIKLEGSVGGSYGAYTNKLFLSDMMINPGETKTLKIRFKKNISSNSSSQKINFLKVIRDYNTYINDTLNYNDVLKIAVKVED